MKAGFYDTPVEIYRRQDVESEYRTKDVWTLLRSTKCKFEWLAGARVIENTEMFYSQSARITLRSYIDIQDEDHVRIKGVDYRVVSINKRDNTVDNDILVNIEKINK